MSYTYCTVLDLDQQWHVAIDQTDDMSRSFATFEAALANARERSRQSCLSSGNGCVLRVRSPSGEWHSEILRAEAFGGAHA